MDHCPRNLGGVGQCAEVEVFWGQGQEFLSDGVVMTWSGKMGPKEMG